MTKTQKRRPRKEVAVKPRPLTLEQLIYIWKVEGGNVSWARWAALVDVPVKKL